MGGSRSIGCRASLKLLLRDVSNQTSPGVNQTALDFVVADVLAWIRRKHQQMKTLISSEVREGGGCAHQWRRGSRLEQELPTFVYIRSCARCGQVEAKAGHKDPLSTQGWELIEEGTKEPGGEERLALTGTS